MEWLIDKVISLIETIPSVPEKVSEWTDFTESIVVILGGFAAFVSWLILRNKQKKSRGHVSRIDKTEEGIFTGIKRNTGNIGVVIDNSVNTTTINNNISREEPDQNTPLPESKERADDTPPEQNPVARQIKADKNAEQGLSDILSSRLFSHINVLERIQALRRSVTDGNNRSTVSPATRLEINYWVARLCACDSSTIEVAKQVREELHSTAPDRDLSVVDALIAHTEGDEDKALRLLRDQDNPDASATLFTLLRTQGNDKALSWFERQQDKENLHFFTPIGWFYWAVCMSAIGKWEEAAQRMGSLHDFREEMPTLAMLEGQINAAMLLPEDFRYGVLEGPPLYIGIAPSQGRKKEACHARARECFEYLGQHRVVRDDPELIKFTKYWQRWLGLMSPKSAQLKTAREEIRQLMETGNATALEVMDFANAFNVSYDPRPLRRYLEDRTELGGLSDPEMKADCLVNERLMPAVERVAYFEEHQPRLRKIMPLPFLLGMQVAALLDNKQTDKARALVREHTDDLDEAHSRALLANINRHGGQDTCRELENLYREEKSLGALQGLISCLKDAGNRTALLPYVREMFDRVPNADNALGVIACLPEKPFDHAAVLDFLAPHADIVEQSDALQEAKAWALFRAGRFQEAKEVNYTLLEKRGHPNDRYLEIQVATCTGDWEHVTTIIDQIWPKRATHDPEFLMTLAQIAALQDNTPRRALELAVLAREKAPDDPRIASAAIELHFRLGQDRDVNPDWFKPPASASSTKDNAPRLVSIEEMVSDLMPKRRNYVEEITKKWADGELPASLAVKQFGLSLARFIIDTPTRNAREPDARRRTILPLVAGGREPLEIRDSQTIGLDMTSILLLTGLGLLETALAAFHHVKLPAHTMEFLFQEKRNARFHQPSRIEAAKQAQRLQNRGQLQAAACQDAPPPSLSREVGTELAALLVTAAGDGCRVVCDLPIQKAGSLLEPQPADISGHDRNICTLIDLCTALKETGHLNAADHEWAVHYFTGQGQVERTGNLSSSCLDKPVYIDRTAFFYLQDANMLEQMARPGLDLRVHPAVLAEQHALVEAGDSGEDLIRKIEAIRHCLRNAVSAGSASFLPASSGIDESHGPELEAVRALLEDNQECDVVCMDDRFYNKFPLYCSSSNKTILIACIPDVLRYLLAQGRITDAEHWNLRHRLRHGGVAFIPPEEDELVHWLKAAPMNEDGRVEESMELRALRQSQARFGTSGFATRAERQSQSLTLHAATFYGTVIYRLWEDETLPTERAATLSDWVWHNLRPTAFLLPPMQPAHDPGDPAYSAVPACEQHVFGNVSVLLKPLDNRDGEARRERFTGWLDQAVFRPLRQANAGVADNAIKNILALLQQETVAVATAEAGNVWQKHYGNRLLRQVPETDRNRILGRWPEIKDQYGYKTQNLLTIGADEQAVQVEMNALFAAVRDAFADNGEQAIPDSAGKPVSVRLDDDGCIVIEWADLEGRKRSLREDSLPELMLLSPDPGTRRVTRDTILGQLGPTATDSRDAMEAVGQREPEYRELSTLFDERVNGVIPRQARLLQKVSRGEGFNVEDIAPRSGHYFERFAGPAPGAEQSREDYVRETLIPYRQALLRRDLKAGLDTCCLGALSDELSPGEWVGDAGNDALWEALDACRPKSNPFSLLGALDVALYRQDDPRFRRFAEEAVAQLLDRNFGQGDGPDFYRLLQVAANGILNRVHALEDQRRYPGYWKQTGAWMQAALFARAVASDIDLDSFEQWTYENMFSEVSYSLFVNGWKEIPLVAETSAYFLRGAPQFLRDLRAEIVGRLLALKVRHERAGRVLPGSEHVEAALARHREQGTGFIAGAPGTILGCPQAANPLPSDLSQELEKADPDNAEFWSSLAMYSQYHVPGAPVLARVRDAVKSLADNNWDADTGATILVRLHMAGAAAAMSRDMALADEIRDALLNIIPGLGEEYEFLAWAAVNVLLRTAGAHRTQQAWQEWLYDALAKMALHLPTEMLPYYADQLDLVGEVFSVDSWFHVRARAIASVGM